MLASGVDWLSHAVALKAGVLGSQGPVELPKKASQLCMSDAASGDRKEPHYAPSERPIPFPNVGIPYRFLRSKMNLFRMALSPRIISSSRTVLGCLIWMLLQYR